MPEFRGPAAAPRPVRALLVLLVLLVGSLSPASAPARVVVLGFDGADARLVQQWMDEGKLPNLDRMRREGTWAPLGTTTPPQTPVSWTSFATGINPGRHGIFDFLSRDVATYQPGYAMFDIRDQPVGAGKANGPIAGGLVGLLAAAVAWPLLRRSRARLAIVVLAAALTGGAAGLAVARLVPAHRPVVTRKTVGTPFWEVAANAGKKCRIVRVPAMFPPDPVKGGEIHAGLGVPDIRGTNGNYTYYTTETMSLGGANTEKGGRIENVAFLDGHTTTTVYGPRNRLFDEPPDITLPLELKLRRNPGDRGVDITVGGRTITLAEKAWSDWVELEFAFNPLIKAHGLARFYLQSVEPFGLYLSPINLDPRHPLLPITRPDGWSAELARRFGIYRTLGWENDTFALDENVLGEEAFLADVDQTVESWLPMMDALLTEGDVDLYVHVWDFTDRIGHMFWRTIDPTSPAADSLADAEWNDVMIRTYQRMDSIVGRVREKLPPGSTLLVCSDHGFNTWHKSVNYNTWLVRNGFMTLKGPEGGKALTLDDLFGQGEFWPNVDWSKTKAYALGLGDLYVNLKGRESQGCVDPADYETVRRELIAGLEAFVDSSTGERPVRRVIRREDVYTQFDPNLIPDLFLANSEKYRVSWQTSLGGIPAQLFEINDKKWSGDHCSLDAEITKGIFLSSARYDAPAPNILDLYPTILNELGVTVPAGLDGTALPRRAP
jgi:predicted AlkP superfamily phosphohydrolase/phosphomutase